MAECDRKLITWGELHEACQKLCRREDRERIPGRMPSWIQDRILMIAIRMLFAWRGYLPAQEKRIAAPLRGV